MGQRTDRGATGRRRTRRPRDRLTDFVKRHIGAPAGFFACEAAGLQWLSQAEGGVPCVPVVSVDATSLTLRRLESVTPSAEAAFEFGSRLAATHDAGAAGFGG